MSGRTPNEPSRETTSPASVDHAISPLDITTVLLASAADGVLLASLLRSQLGLSAFLAGHLTIVLLISLVLVSNRRNGRDTTMLALAALGLFCIGPIGAIGALTATVLAPLQSGTTKLLSDWYQRIAHSIETDPVGQLCDMVAIGRSVDLGGPPPTSFAAVMSHGSLTERQALLGLIARNFDIEYLPALKIALTSPEPVIRVQAAAVATKVQTALHRIVQSWAARLDLDEIDTLGGIVVLRACLGSGLIEAGDRVTAERTIATLRSHAIAATLAPDFEFRLLAARDNANQLSAIAAFEDLLLQERRFKKLRNWRRLKPAGQWPTYRVARRTPQRRSRLARPLEVTA